jgi:uncharacterized repeat protein (TIGR03847 family)
MLVHRHDPPDRFVVGTVGEPGARTFYLQARSGRLVTSVSLEKEQVAILAERVGVLLDELVRTGDVLAPDATAGVADADPLEQPLVDEFRVGTMTLSWDADDKRVVIEAFPVGEDDAPPAAEPEDGETDEDEVESGPGAVSEVFVVRLLPAAARGFAERAGTVISAGRPPCPFCGQPLDPTGHLCPRSNGHKQVEM